MRSVFVFVFAILTIQSSHAQFATQPVRIRLPDGSIALNDWTRDMKEQDFYNVRAVATTIHRSTIVRPEYQVSRTLNLSYAFISMKGASDPDSISFALRLLLFDSMVKSANRSPGAHGEFPYRFDYGNHLAFKDKSGRTWNSFVVKDVRSEPLIGQTLTKLYSENRLTLIPKSFICSNAGINYEFVVFWQAAGKDKIRYFLAQKTLVAFAKNPIIVVQHQNSAPLLFATDDEELKSIVKSFIPKVETQTY